MEFSSSCNALNGSPLALTSLALSMNENGASDLCACKMALYAVCECPAFLAIFALVSQSFPVASFASRLCDPLSKNQYLASWSRKQLT